MRRCRITTTACVRMQQRGARVCDHGSCVQLDDDVRTPPFVPCDMFIAVVQGRHVVFSWDENGCMRSCDYNMYVQPEMTQAHEDGGIYGQC